MLELHGPKPVTNPLVEIGKHARCFREPEVSLPTREILYAPIATKFRSAVK
jgi:hypothetical protein